MDARSATFPKRSSPMDADPTPGTLYKAGRAVVRAVPPVSKYLYKTGKRVVKETVKAAKASRIRQNPLVGSIGRRIGSAGTQIREAAGQASTRYLTHSNPKRRKAAVVALRSLGPDAVPDEALHKLVGLLYDEDAGVRAEAATTIGRAGARARHLLDNVAQLLDDPDKEVRLRAAEAVASIAKAAAMAPR